MAERFPAALPTACAGASTEAVNSNCLLSLPHRRVADAQFGRTLNYRTSPTRCFGC